MPSAFALLGVSAVSIAVAIGLVGLTALPGSVIGPAASQSPTESPSSSPGTTPLWPQSTLEEVQAAQERADAADPLYTWQVDSALGEPSHLGQHHPHDSEIFTRFLEQQLGWEGYLWNEAFAHPDGLRDGEVVYVRCAPGGTNSLYAANPEARCGPTIDEVHYETVKIRVAQLARDGASGIWVVTGWEEIEAVAQAAPLSDAEVSASLGAFTQARIDGTGAERFVDVSEGDPLAAERVGREVPLLYATSNGTAYERADFEVVDGPVWPEGQMQVAVRLFAENGGKVVQQVFRLLRDATGRAKLVYDYQPNGKSGPIEATTENGSAVPVEYGFLDGEVTYLAAAPLAPSQDGFREPDRLAVDGLLRNDDAPRRVLLMLADPRPTAAGCANGPPAADAEALARDIASDPDFEAGTPVTMTFGGLRALQMDVTSAAGSDCLRLLEHAPFGGLDRARLWLFDLPGESARVLAVVMITDDDSFVPVLAYAAPVVESIRLHAP